MTNTRISKDLYYLHIAKDISTRATCLRRKFGAVIVKNDAIVSTGYNGAPRGCMDSLTAGWCYREEKQIPSGERYEMCRSVHAEQNAIIHAGRERTIDSTLYLSGVDAKTGRLSGIEPCLLCTKMIINAGIRRTVVQKTEDTYLELSLEEMIKRFEKCFER
ncbi:MAG: dCMP deaminase family protein [Spirochaetales bacterium]|nr:dCMP deaminase family protein [Spirochaetales bacterium]